MSAKAARAARNRIFISYTHDSPAHLDRVRELANRLRREGLRCEIDQFHEAPPEGWPLWMVKQIEDASYVMVICTANYGQRFAGREKKGKGRGAKWEGGVITQQIYDAELINSKFIPVVLEEADIGVIPTLLRGATYYNVASEDGYQKLYRRLTQQPEIVAPPVADSIREMPPREDEEYTFQFSREMNEQALYYAATFEVWPKSSLKGEDVIPKLEDLVSQVNAKPKFRTDHPGVAATFLRCLGAAYIIHSKMEFPDKIRKAVPYLRQSVEVFPEQVLIKEKADYLEDCLRKGQVDMREYLANTLLIMHGHDPEIPDLVNKMMASQESYEHKAQVWLLKEATPNPIWNFLEAMRVMIKNQTGKEFSIEVNSRRTPENLVEVEAKVGPNALLWNVDFEAKTFKPASEFTTQFMELIANAK